MFAWSWGRGDGLVIDRVYLGVMKWSGIGADGRSASMLIKTHYNYVP